MKGPLEKGLAPEFEESESNYEGPHGSRLRSPDVYAGLQNRKDART